MINRHFFSTSALSTIKHYNMSWSGKCASLLFVLPSVRIGSVCTSVCICDAWMLDCLIMLHLIAIEMDVDGSLKYFSIYSDIHCKYFVLTVFIVANVSIALKSDGSIVANISIALKLDGSKCPVETCQV